VVAWAGLRAQAPAQPANLEDWKPDTLHNIQVLPKDLTPDALMTLMRAWNASLNVDCVFCHKGQVGKPWSTYDFTDDTKKRHEVARMMVKATIRLNEEFKDLGEMDEPTKVTCATCHRRSRHPEITPPAAPPKPEK
jgi:cytochrome c peroxidase